MRKYVALLACSFIAFQIHAEPEIKGSATELRQFLTGVPSTATVVGEGELKIPAERAIITLKVATENKSLQGAMKQNQAMRGKLLNYLKGQGVPTDRVQVARFSSTPKYGVFGEKAKSYRVENLIKITALGEKEFQAASGAVDEWPEVQYQSIEFEQGDKEELKKRVIAKACDNANEQRKIYEEKFGVRLVPKTFAVGAAGQKTVRAPEGEYAAKLYRSTPMASLPSGEAPMEIQDTGLAFGEIVYVAKVTVEYAVEQK